MRASIPFVLLLLSAACTSRQPAPIARLIVRDSFSIPGPARVAGELTPELMRRLAPRVRSIQLEQPAVTIAPGDTFTIFRLVVRVLDSAGVTLGRTRLYNFGLVDGAAALDPPPVVRGRTEGESQMRMSFPERLWAGRSDAPPETWLRITVRQRQP